MQCSQKCFTDKVQDQVLHVAFCCQDESGSQYHRQSKSVGRGGEEGRKRKRGRERETEIERKTERQRHKRSHRQKNRDRERQRELGLTDLLFANSSVNEISLLVLAGKREKADKSQFKLKKLTMK